MYNQAPSYLSQIFTQRNQIHDRETRDPNELDIPKYRTVIGQRRSHLNAEEPNF